MAKQHQTTKLGKHEFKVITDTLRSLANGFESIEKKLSKDEKLNVKSIPTMERAIDKVQIALERSFEALKEGGGTKPEQFSVSGESLDSIQSAVNEIIRQTTGLEDDAKKPNTKKPKAG